MTRTHITHSALGYPDPVDADEQGTSPYGGRVRTLVYRGVLVDRDYEDFFVDAGTDNVVLLPSGAFARNLRELVAALDHRLGA